MGVGPMGMGHARHYRDIPGCDLVAVVDRDPARRAEAAVKTGAQAFADVGDLIGRVDAVSIASTTSSHREVALRCIEAGIHVLVEKPLAQTVADAEAIVAAAAEKGVVLQVGHIERFNPAFRAALDFVHDPRYVVADRLSPYSFRSRDTGVVHDLMIHDLDLVLEFVADEVASFEAIGLPVLSPSEDMADARIRFAGGALADIRASRVAVKKMRKIRIFQREGYVSIDYGGNSIDIYRKSEAFRRGDVDPATIDPSGLDDPFGFVFGEVLDVQRLSLDSGGDALRAELTSFLEACRGLHPPEVSGEDGLRAVRLADRIQTEITAYVAREAERAGVQIRKGEREERPLDPPTERMTPIS